MPSNKGFTLVEIMVAVGIIALLGTFGLNNFKSVSQKTRDSLRKQHLTELSTALKIYFQQNGYYIKGSGNCDADTPTFYTTIAPLMSNSSVPQDPLTKMSYCYQSVDNGKDFRLYAKLEECPSQDTIPKVDCQTQYNYLLTSEDPSTIASQPPPPPPLAPAQAAPPAPAPAPAQDPPPTQTALRVFVTKSIYTGNLGGAGGADMKCQQAADAIPALAGKLWRAWISTSSVNAKDRIADGKYVRMDGVSIAQSKTDLLDGTIAVPINLTENSTTPSIYGSENSAYTWTGTDALGNATANACAGWDQPQFANATIGVTTRTTGWSDGGYGADQCQTYQRHLYCFEQPQASQTGGAGCLTAYSDFDNDSYTTGSAVYFCNASSLPFGYKSSASAQTDCDDQNTNTHPEQTQYFTTARTNGSFDYDCSGTAQPQYPYRGLSCGTYQVNNGQLLTNCFPSWACVAVGTATNAADCGKMGNFLSDQTPDLYQCDEAGSFPVHSPEKVILGCR